MIIEEISSHHSGIWVFMTRSSFGVEEVMSVKSVQVTDYVDSKVIYEGNTLRIDCNAQALMIFKQN